MRQDFATCEAEDLEDCLHISTAAAAAEPPHGVAETEGDEAPAPATGHRRDAADIVGAVPPVAGAKVTTPPGTTTTSKSRDDEDDDDGPTGTAPPKRQRGGCERRRRGKANMATT